MNGGTQDSSFDASSPGAAEFAALERAAQAVLKTAAEIAATGPAAPLSQLWQGAFAAARAAVAAPREQSGPIAAFALRTVLRLEATPPAPGSTALAHTLGAAVAELRAAGQDGAAAALCSLALEMAGETALTELLPFFVALEALVRARLAYDAGGFGAHAASSYWRIALDEAARVPGPCLVLCGGLTGSGKSFVATGIAATFGATIAGSDRLRKQLAGIAPTARTPAEANERVYSTRMTDWVYRRLARAAAEALQAGLPIVLDGTYLTPERRAAPLRLAQEFGVPAAIVWCELPEAEAAARLRRRGALGWAVSDGDPRVRALQRSGARPPTGDEFGARLLRVDASPRPAELFEGLNPLLRCVVASR